MRRSALVVRRGGAFRADGGHGPRDDGDDGEQDAELSGRGVELLIQVRHGCACPPLGKSATAPHCTAERLPRASPLVSFGDNPEGDLGLLKTLARWACRFISS